ncbi:hypothetical protein BJV74DRAFT_926953 [Russula compacta]|nr:hypothetical protein BJV74DRAFT_926953 [Russula compacta]
MIIILPKYEDVRNDMGMRDNKDKTGENGGVDDEEFLRHSEGCSDDWKRIGLFWGWKVLWFAHGVSCRWVVWWKMRGEGSGGSEGRKGKEGCEAERGRRQIWVSSLHVRPMGWIQGIPYRGMGIGSGDEDGWAEGALGVCCWDFLEEVCIVPGMWNRGRLSVVDVE